MGRRRGSFFLAIKGYGWLKEIDNTQKCKFRNRCTREKINEITATVKRGGFDEPTIIRQLEIIDVKIPLVPKLIYVYGCPYFLGSDPTGIQEHTIPVPDVLYTLLRLPRRNVQNEISAAVSALDERKRDELTRRWRKFIDPMLTYNEPEADKYGRVARQNGLAVIARLGNGSVMDGQRDRDFAGIARRSWFCDRRFAENGLATLRNEVIIKAPIPWT